MIEQELNLFGGDGYVYDDNDDDRSYFEDVHEIVSPDIHCVQAGIDLKTPYQILEYIEGIE